MKHLLLAVAALAFLLRLGYAVHSGELWHPRTWEQETIAMNLLQDHEFTYYGDRAYVEPLYPFLAAAVYALTNHSQAALVLVQIVIASVTVWVAGWAAGVATGSDAAAIVAALIMAIHPGFVRYASVLHPIVLDAFFFIAAAGLLVRYRQEPSLRRGLQAAAVIGFGALTRPTILVFLLPLCWIQPRRSIAVVATAIAFVAPWTIRNAIVLHEFVLTRSGAGYVFWIGNNPVSSGSATDASGTPIKNKASPELQARLRGVDELTRDRIYREEAWAYIRANPFAAVERVAQRFFYFWWFSPQWGIDYSPKARILYRLWWGVLLASIAIGLIVCRNRDVLLMAALALLISIVQSLYYVDGRHRLAIEPLLFPLAAIGILETRRAVR